MEFLMKMAHLQLTQRCNLRCPFCGQWGERGYAKAGGSGRGVELSPGEWAGIVGQVAGLAQDGETPSFVLWGGEPLLYEGLEEVLKSIRSHGCPVGIVSNGALLERFAGILAEHVGTLYVSLDGPGGEHDRIRGCAGLRERIGRGLSALAGARTKRICLSTISPENWMLLAETAADAQSLGFERIIFQNLIYMLPEEARCYGLWLRERFGMEESNAASWTYESVPHFAKELPAAFKEMERRVEGGEFRIKVEFHPLGLDSSNIEARMEGEPDFLGRPPAHCMAPLRHVNVSPEGMVRFCVDYNDVSLGSLRERSLAEILGSERAMRFREDVAAGRNPACVRCPWRYNMRYEVD